MCWASQWCVVRCGRDPGRNAREATCWLLTTTNPNNGLDSGAMLSRPFCTCFRTRLRIARRPFHTPPGLPFDVALDSSRRSWSTDSRVFRHPGSSASAATGMMRQVKLNRTVCDSWPFLYESLRTSLNSPGLGWTRARGRGIELFFDHGWVSSAQAPLSVSSGHDIHIRRLCSRSLGCAAAASPPTPSCSKARPTFCDHIEAHQPRPSHALSHRNSLDKEHFGILSSLDHIANSTNIVVAGK
jgi:hypothetical protein